MAEDPLHPRIKCFVLKHLERVVRKGIQFIQGDSNAFANGVDIPVFTHGNSPLSSVHVVVYESGIVIVHGAGRIEQRRQQIFFNVADAGCVPLQAIIFANTSLEYRS